MISEMGDEINIARSCVLAGSALAALTLYRRRYGPQWYLDPCSSHHASLRPMRVVPHAFAVKGSTPTAYSLQIVASAHEMKDAATNEREDVLLAIDDI